MLTWNSEGRRKVGCPELRGDRLCKQGRRKGKKNLRWRSWKLNELESSTRLTGPRPGPKRTGRSV